MILQGMWVKSTIPQAAGGPRRRKQTLRKTAERAVKSSVSCSPM